MRFVIYVEGGGDTKVNRTDYDKGSHSFAILAKLDPAKVARSSPHAERLIRTLLAMTSRS